MGVADKIPMETGAVAPDFKNVRGVDGQIHSLSEYANSPILVVVFSCNHCPYVQAYEDRLISLQQEFKNRGVQFIAINSNDASTHPDDSFENMKKRALEKKFNFPYLRDESQDVAKAYRASHTPHLFVFDKDRRLRYTGKIDDNWQNPSQVRERYLYDALVALTEGRLPKEPATFAIGCTIKWKP